MGYIMHDAIIVTSFRKGDAEKARDEAIRCKLPVSELLASPVNSYYTFLIGPDGSKEGWADSDAFEVRRGRWKAWAAEQYSAGVYFDWVNVRYGESAAFIASTSSPEDI